jgi:hypothetical protein
VPAPRIAVPIAIGVLAIASLFAPFQPFYDPWGWLIWGRELVHLDLDTGAGPSWKPLPALIDAVLSVGGGAAPALWLVIARAGWLTAAALAFRLAWRLALPGSVSGMWAVGLRSSAARVAAGLIAGAGVVLLSDPFTSWTRQFAGGLSEPLLVALVLGAVDRALSRRPGQALGIGLAAALLRPEVWPFLVAYGIYLWPRTPRLRTPILGVAAAIPILWLVPDLLGSGDPLTGAERAREATGTPLHEGVESIGRSLELPLAALWVGGVAAVASARRRGEAELVVIGAGAIAWIAIVAVLAAAGYAGLPRFAAPAAAIACVLGAVGVVRMAHAATGHRRWAALALAGALLAGLVIQGGVRAAELPGEVEQAADYGRSIDRLRQLVADDVGAERFTGCPPVTTTDFLSGTALAWELDLPITDIHPHYLTVPTGGTAIVDEADPDAATRGIEATATPLGRVGEWVAYAISCDAASSAASGRAITGVSGASR